jgi:RNA polymerase sigma factor (sigma-70 family)
MIDAMRRCSDYTRQEMRAGDSKVQRVFSLKDEDVMSTRPSQEMEVLASQVLRALDRLSARERHIVLMRDVEEWTGSEVGADIGVTEARVCQLRKESIARVRAELAYGEAA